MLQMRATTIALMLEIKQGVGSKPASDLIPRVVQWTKSMTNFLHTKVP